MKKVSKLLSILILTFMFGIVVIAAVNPNQTSLGDASVEEAQKTTSTLLTPTGANACNSNIGFTARKTLRMSLVKLDQPFDFDLTSEIFSVSYAQAVQLYGSNYYVTCPEEALYYPVSGDNPTTTYRNKPVVLYSGENVAKFPTCGKVFNSIMNDMADNDVVKTSPINGAKYITPESGVINQLVTELSQLGGYNYQLAQEYLNSQSNDELAQTPIAVCIEVVAPVIGEGDPYFASAADMCYRIGGESAYRSLISTNFYQLGGNFNVHAETLRRKGTPQEASATDIAIAKICDYYDGDVNADSWPYRWTKRFFGTMWKSNGKMYNGWRKHLTDVFSVWAWDAWQTYSDRATGINGCTLVALEPTDVWPGNLGNGLTNGRPADDPQTHPAGKYTWHIDAEGASVTASGHREDQTVKVRGAASGPVSKTNVVGALSLNQTNSYEWQNWLTQIGATSIDVEVHRYHLGQGNFTTERSAILGSGSAATGNGVTNSSESAVTTFTLTFDEYLDAMRNPDTTFDISTDTLGSCFENGELKVAYATEVFVTPKNADTSFMRIQLSNDQVHWINYSADSSMTYKFQQVVGNGYAQIKQGGLGAAEKFEAMAGTPTTEPLFVDMGGEQFVVNMQYRYVQEPYERFYKFETTSTPNYMYYNACDNDSGTGKGSDGYSKSPSKSSSEDEALSNAKSQAKRALGSISTNYGKQGYSYKTCITNWNEIKSWIDGWGNGSSSRSWTLFDADDLDTNQSGKVTITVSCDSTDTSKSSKSCGTPPGPTWTEYKYESEKDWNISIHYDSTVSRSIKDMSNTIEFSQIFHDVKYMDIIECHVWQLAEGREMGLGAIVTDPATANDVIKLAVNQMGYTFYNSEQIDKRNWDDAKQCWKDVTAANASDLEQTGRLVNSYNKKFVGDTADDHSYHLTSTGDTLVMTYNPNDQGGRSHHCFGAFINQALAHSLYSGSGKPYSNTILCTSDNLAIHAGDSAGHDWIVFCDWNFNTGEYVNITGLEQYLARPDVPRMKVFRSGTTYNKGSRNAISSDLNTALKAREFQYRDGDVFLDLSDEYLNATKQAICETNEYTFVNLIEQNNDMPRTGYKGDYQTRETSHVTTNYTKRQNYDPMTYNVAFNGEMNSYRSGVTSFAKNCVQNNTAVVAKAYPYKEGFNVNRTQQNNIYRTGVASILYKKQIESDLISNAAVDSICLYDDYSTVRKNALRDSSTYPHGIFLDATYDDSWDRVNDIVIFNPSSVENAYIPKLTEYLPDAMNTEGTDKNTNPLRDQRVTGVYSDSNDSVLTESTNTSSLEEEMTSVTSNTYMLKTASNIATSYYTEDDYIRATTESDSTATVGNGSSYVAPTSTNYTLTLYDSSANSTSVVAYLPEDTRIYNDGTSVIKDGRDYRLSYNEVMAGTYGDLSDMSHISDDDVDLTNFEVSDGDSLTLITSSAGTVYAGDVVKLSMNLLDSDSDSVPFSVAAYDGDRLLDVNKYSEHRSNDWEYIIEFNETCTLSRIKITFNRDTVLSQSTSGTSMLTFEDVYLFDIGTAYSNPIAVGTSVEYFYDTDSQFYYGSNHVRSYNSTAANYTDTDATHIGSTEVGKLYVSYNPTASLAALSESAKKSPHKVYNANWRYYVTGWQTTTGVVINSPSNPLLSIPSTLLYWPGQKSKTVSVAELKTDACLVKLNGQTYITLRDDGLNYVITQTGMRVTSYDDITTGSEPVNYSYVDGGGYPLGSNLNNNCVYEFFFKLSDSNGYLYDVRRATNMNYRYALDDTSTSYWSKNGSGTEKENWQYDWDVQSHIFNDNTNYADLQNNVVLKSDGGCNLYLSMDDEFCIKFNNKGNYKQSDAHNIAQVSKVLGYGWTDNMDVSKWIQDKYVIFPFDVYVFDEYDTTYANSNNTQRILAPAGTKIPLGYYEGDDGEADDQGHWIDYGTGSNTHDPDSDTYTYNFWVSLSASECKDAEVSFNSENINAGSIQNEHANNKNYENPPVRYHNAKKDVVCDIVGRIGAFTIVDSGDYRWQDTFKTTEPDAEWRVHNLIRKLSDYSNVYGITSTQRSLVMDPYDVRGRIAISQFNSDAGYSTYGNESNNTYNTQWYKQTDTSGDHVSKVGEVPLTSAFNDHDSLKMTEQKLGYQNYCTLESIGSYYGESTDTAENDTFMTNGSGDYGNYKVQIRPVYIAVELDDAGNFQRAYTTDVYMKSGNTYKLINSGSTEVDASVVEALGNNVFTYTIQGNTTGNELDQNMKRRMVTEQEAEVTRKVCSSLNSTAGYTLSHSLLTPTILTNVSETGFFADELNPGYTYGNAQMLFLRARNRTYVGKASEALEYDRTSLDMSEYSVIDIRHMRNAQKWYFNLGLPSSAVFVPHGQELTTTNQIRKANTYILSTIDVYSNGYTWLLHYESPVSRHALKIKDTTLTSAQWNPVQDKLPWLVPVTVYDTYDTKALDDLNTEGTH